MPIRSASKAIILHKGKVLVNRCITDGVDHFSLPGGGQNTYEPMEETVVRECLEETGYRVEPVRFAAIGEEIFDNPEMRRLYSDYSHRMYHIFLCRLVDEVKSAPTEMDESQIESIWVDVEDLDSLYFLPATLNGSISKIIKEDCTLFLGTSHYKGMGHG